MTPFWSDVVGIKSLLVGAKKCFSRGGKDRVDFGKSSFFLRFAAPEEARTKNRSKLTQNRVIKDKYVDFDPPTPRIQSIRDNMTGFAILYPNFKFLTKYFLL